MVVHAEHDPAGRENDAEPQAHRKQSERRQLQPQGRQQPNESGGRNPDRERGEAEEKSGGDHARSR